MGNALFAVRGRTQITFSFIVPFLGLVRVVLGGNGLDLKSLVCDGADEPSPRVASLLVVPRLASCCSTIIVRVTIDLRRGTRIHGEMGNSVACFSSQPPSLLQLDYNCPEPPTKSKPS